MIRNSLSKLVGSVLQCSSRLLVLLGLLLLGGYQTLPTALGQVATLADANQSLTVTLSAAPATTQPNYFVSWTGTGGPLDAVGATTGLTAVTALAGIAGGPRDVQAVHIYNADTASVTATLKKVISGTSYSLVSATIPVGGTLRWTRTNGIQIIDSGGLNATATVGSVPSGIAATTVAGETGSGAYRKTTITCTLTPLTAANTTGASFGSRQIYDFPEGRILILGVTCNFTQIKWTGTGIDAAGSGDYSVGTTATADATLSGTDVDLLPSSAMLDPFVLGVGRSNAGTALAASAQFDGTATAKDAYLNAIIDDADVADADSSIVLFTGNVTISWLLIGDY